MMIQLRRAALLTAFLSTLSFAQTDVPAVLSQHDRDFAMSQMHATRKLFLDSVAGLTPAQWSFKSAPDRWSIAECAEHIAISEEFMSGLVRDRIMKMPAAPEKRKEVKVSDEKIGELMIDRSHKFQAPEQIAPVRRWPDTAEIVAHFKTARDANIAYLESTNDPLRTHFFVHPAFGMLDGFQWLLAMCSHTERHTLQILEIKADPNFPK